MWLDDDAGAVVPVCRRCGRAGVVDGYRVNPHGPGLLCLECLRAIRAQRWRRLAAWTVTLAVCVSVEAAAAWFLVRAA